MKLTERHDAAKEITDWDRDAIEALNGLEDTRFYKLQGEKQVTHTYASPEWPADKTTTSHTIMYHGPFANHSHVYNHYLVAGNDWAAAMGVPPGTIKAEYNFAVNCQLVKVIVRGVVYCLWPTYAAGG